MFGSRHVAYPENEYTYLAQKKTVAYCVSRDRRRIESRFDRTFCKKLIILNQIENASVSESSTSELSGLTVSHITRHDASCCVTSVLDLDNDRPQLVPYGRPEHLLSSFFRPSRLEHQGEICSLHPSQRSSHACGSIMSKCVGRCLKTPLHM